jgi:DNA-binding CsgD family transcriptional regulator
VPDFDALDRIARSGEAVFAMDSADRIILWNKKCEELLGRPARSVLGKACHTVLNGRDVHGNIYCHRNCSVADQARRQNAADPVQSFPLSVETGSGETKWINVSMFVVPSYHAALSTVVHVLRPQSSAPTALEKDLEKHASAPGPTLWPLTTAEGQPIELSRREKEILLCLAEGLSTPEIAKRLFIAPVTVRNHVQSILQKLDVHTKLAAVVFAYRHGLI